MGQRINYIYFFFAFKQRFNKYFIMNKDNFEHKRKMGIVRHSRSENNLDRKDE